MQLMKTDSVSLKPEKPAAVLQSPDAPPAPSSSTSSTRATTKTSGSVHSVSQAPHATPAELGQSLNLPLDGTGGKEEYGYIFTNQRSALFYSLLFNSLIPPKMTKKLLGLFLL